LKELNNTAGWLSFCFVFFFCNELITLKNRHIDIIAPNFANFYRQIFEIFKFMFFMDGTQKKMKLSRKVITHPSFASLIVCEIKNKKSDGKSLQNLVQ
jgi:hypothetical protein